MRKLSIRQIVKLGIVLSPVFLSLRLVNILLGISLSDLQRIVTTLLLINFLLFLEEIANKLYRNS